MKRNLLIAIVVLAAASASPQLVRAQAGRDADVSVGGRTLLFSPNAQPYYVGRTVMVPARETSEKLGVDFRRNDRGDELTLTYRGDVAIYRKWDRQYLLNNQRMNLPIAAQEVRAVLFLPSELFERLVGRPIDARVRQNGGLDPWRPGDRPDWDSNYNNVRVRFERRELRFNRDEQPRVVQGRVYVPLRATAGQTGVSVGRDASGSNITLRRGSDRIEYDNGREHFDLNGRRIRMMAPSLEINDVLYVPDVMFEALLGSTFEASSDSIWPGQPDDRQDSAGNLRILYRSRELQFDEDERPFLRRGEVYVPVRAFADRLRVSFFRMTDGRRIRLTRDNDVVWYTQPSTYYELNGKIENLRAGSLEVRGTLFVPIDVFNVFADGRVQVVRR